MPNPAWENADGLTVKFGSYYKDPTNFANRSKGLSILGANKQIEMDIDLSLIPTGTVSYTTDLLNAGALTGFNSGDVRLPANASVKEVVLVMSVAAAGGTSFVVGTFQQAGTVVSANSLITATEGVLANVNAIGKRIYGAGALVSTAAGTAGVGVSNAYIGVTTTGTFTAGKGRLILIYVDPTAEAVAP